MWYHFAAYLACRHRQNGITQARRAPAILAAGGIILALSGCMTPPLPERVPPAEVVQPDFPAVTRIAPDPVTTPFRPSADTWAPLPAFDAEVPALELSGSRADICAVLAAEMNFGLLQSTFAAPEAPAVPEQADGPPPVGAVDVADELFLSWPGGTWSGLLALLGRFDLSLQRVGRVLVCGAPATWRLVRPLNMSAAAAATLFDSVTVDEVGGLWLLRGTPAAMLRAEEVLTALIGAPLTRDVQVYPLPEFTDLSLLSTWLETAGLVDYALVGRRLVAPPYLIGAVLRFLAARPQADCAPREWFLRTARPQLVLPFLSAIYPSDRYCSAVAADVAPRPAASAVAVDSASEGAVSLPPAPRVGGGGGGGLYLDEDRGVIVAWVSAENFGAWLAAMERADPAPRPVVLRWLLMNLARDDRESIGYRFADYTGGSLESITGGASFRVDLSDLSGILSAALSRETGSAVINVSAPGLVGVEVAAASTRSVAFAAGAVVDEAGVVRQQLQRVNLGVDVKSTVWPVHAGWSMDYSFSLSAPAPGGSYTQISRAGRLFVPRDQAVVLLVIRDQAGSDSRSLTGLARTDAVGDIYILVEVLPGLLM